MNKIFKTRYIEQFQPTVAGGQQYFFPDLSELRDAKIYGISTYPVETVPYTQLGNQPVLTVDLIKSYLTLYFAGGNYIQVPMVDLIAVRQSILAGTVTSAPFNQFPFALMGQVVIWQKSYVWIANTAGLTIGKYFQFVVQYDDKGIMQMGNLDKVKQALGVKQK